MGLFGTIDKRSILEWDSYRPYPPKKKSITRFQTGYFYFPGKSMSRGRAQCTQKTVRKRPETLDK